MKNFIKSILLMIISLFLLIGCSSKESEKTIDSFINKLISVNTYEDIKIGENTEDDVNKLKSNFGEYLTEDAFNTLIANRIPNFYYTVINENNINDIADIKIVKTKETDTDTYTHYEYEVSYKLKSDTKTIDMTDYIVFKVMKDNTSIISEVSVLDKTSSIFSEYKNVSK